MACSSCLSRHTTFVIETLVKAKPQRQSSEGSRISRRPGSVSNFKFKTVIIVIIVSKALPCFDLGVTWERKVTSPQSKIKHSCNLRFLKNLVQNLRRSGCDVQYLSEILNSCILSVSFKPPAVNGIYIKVKIYSFIQTTRYFILTIEAVRSEERVFETESTIFLLKFLPISCFLFFFCFTSYHWF